MVQKKEGLESLVRTEFQNLSFYSSQHDALDITGNNNEKYTINYDAIKPAEEKTYADQYFNCCIEIDLKEKSATWNYIHLSEEYRNKGWGRELISRGESLFKKLGIQTAYVHNNINHGFWTRMGYPLSLKVLKKKVKKKNFYYRAYEFIGSISDSDDANVFITEYDSTFELSYDFRKKESYEDQTSIELKVDPQNKTATWTRMESPKGKTSSIITKGEKMLRSLGIKEVYIDMYNAGPIWGRKGYRKHEENMLYKKLD